MVARYPPCASDAINPEQSLGHYGLLSPKSEAGHVASRGWEQARSGVTDDESEEVANDAGVIGIEMGINGADPVCGQEAECNQGHDRGENDRAGDAQANGPAIHTGGQKTQQEKTQQTASEDGLELGPKVLKGPGLGPEKEPAASDHNQ